MQARFPTIGRFSLLIGFAVLVLGFVLMAPAALAQRVLLDEDFESYAPGTPGADTSADTFNRSIVIEGDPADAFVTGGSVADPFDPGNNQSLVLYNPNNAAQEAINWFSIFPDDAGDPFYYLKNGVIQFDAFIDTLQPDGYFGFLGIRFGFEMNPEDRNQVSADGDETIWNSFRFQSGGLAEGGTNFFFDQGNNQSYVNDDLFFAGDNNGYMIPYRVVYTINGTTATYDVTIQNLDPDSGGEPVAVFSDAPWKEVFNFLTFEFEPAPGINEVTFITDASARGVGSLSSPNVYIDNLLIIDNDQEPGPEFEADFDMDGDVDGDDFLLWQTGFPTASGAVKMDGDYDNDGDVDGDDFLGWQAEFPSPGEGQGAGAVPEPTALVMAMLVMSLLIPLRRRNPRS